jgi:Protein of unknown function (DUF2726)
LGWLLFLLAVAGGVAFAIWNFHRKTNARRAASEARFEKIFKGSAQVPVSPPPPASAAPESPAPAKAPPAASAVPPAAAQRFLGEAESVLYYLLKSGLPGFEVFAGVSLARVVGAAGDGREQQLRRLAQYQLDFVVCDKNMQVVAVVEVESAAGADAAGDRRFKSDLLKQAGIKLVRINPAALPPREQMRTFIGGGLPQ